MTAVLLPPVPYDRTSLRPAWQRLPASFRRGLSARLGAPVIATWVTGTGFTPGFAATVSTADGGRHFVKAAELSAPAAEWYAREARFAAALPSRVPAPRLLWAEAVADHFVLCFEAIEGARVPSLPWSPAQLDAALQAVALAAEVLSDPPEALLAAEPDPWSVVLDSSLNKWQSTGVEELARLEARFDELTRGVTTLLHCDLRLDNIVIDSAGKAWICDWNWIGYGPPWFDTMSLLLSAEASGLDVDALFAAHPTAAGLPSEALDAALAAIAGYYRYAGAQPEVDTSPHIRTHQRYYGTLALRWLARRQSWAPTEPVLALPGVAW